MKIINFRRAMHRIFCSLFLVCPTFIGAALALLASIANTALTVIQTANGGTASESTIIGPAITNWTADHWSRGQARGRKP